MAEAEFVVDDALDAAESIVNHHFNDRDLLALALTHASSANHRLVSNERLEFLGDAVLGMIVCEQLFRNYPRLQEGELTKVKSSVVSRDTCAIVARHLGIDRLIRVGKGMNDRDGVPSSLAAGVFESILGALYLDAGMSKARDFVLTCMDRHIKQAVSSGHQRNFKSVLQQISQQSLYQTPQYIMLDEKGPDHAKCFEVCVEVGVQRYPSSWGRSKKQAEQQAALNALVEMGYAWVDEEGEVHLHEVEGVTANGEADDSEE